MALQTAGILMKSRKAGLFVILHKP